LTKLESFVKGNCIAKFLVDIAGDYNRDF